MLKYEAEFSITVQEQIIVLQTQIQKSNHPPNTKFCLEAEMTSYHIP